MNERILNSSIRQRVAEFLRCVYKALAKKSQRCVLLTTLIDSNAKEA